MTVGRTDALVLPRYGERSLTEVVPSVGAALGLPGLVDVLGLPASSRYVIFVVDGLGAQQLREAGGSAPYLASLLDDHEPLTCGVPSTTATSLTSLSTSLPPGRHGLVGYTCRIPGTNRLLNTLKWDADVDPVAWQPHPSAFTRLGALGAQTMVVNSTSFETSGLTRCGQRHVAYHGIDSPWERLEAVCDAAAVAGSVTYAYESVLDHTGHEAGWRSPRWLAELTRVDAELLRLRSELPTDAVLLVTADHGMVDVGPDDRVDVDEAVDLLDDVTLIGGEARFRHVYARAGAAADVADRWTAVLGERALVRTRDEAVAAGWFGSVSERVRPRLGDVVAASTGSSAVLCRRLFPVEARMVGFHGSLTAQEMNVPLLVDAPDRAVGNSRMVGRELTDGRLGTHGWAGADASGGTVRQDAALWPLPVTR
ncbi:MAG: alkaline phosphatase family protein [Nocardioidaceae bacterium]